MVQLLDSSGQPLKAAPRMRVSDTAHRAASLRTRELASWMPLLGSADSDFIDKPPTRIRLDGTPFAELAYHFGGTAVPPETRSRQPSRRFETRRSAAV